MRVAPGMWTCAGKCIGAGTAGLIFRLGEQKLVKNNQYNHIQSITLCSMYIFQKRYTQCTMGSGAKPPRSWEISRIFVLKVTLHSVRLLLTVSYRKSGGAGCTCPVSPPVSMPMGECWTGK